MKLLFIFVDGEKGIIQADLDTIKDRGLAQGYTLQVLYTGGSKPDISLWTQLLTMSKGGFLRVDSSTKPEVIWDVIRKKSAKDAARYYACNHGTVPHCVTTAVSRPLR